MAQHEVDQLNRAPARSALVGLRPITLTPPDLPCQPVVPELTAKGTKSYKEGDLN